MPSAEMIQSLCQSVKWYHEQYPRKGWGVAIHATCQGDDQLKSLVGKELGRRGVVVKRQKKLRTQAKARAKVGLVQLQLPF
jgi:hypothetical protein